MSFALIGKARFHGPDMVIGRPMAPLATNPVVEHFEVSTVSLGGEPGRGHWMHLRLPTASRIVYRLE